MPFTSLSRPMNFDFSSVIHSLHTRNGLCTPVQHKNPQAPTPYVSYRRHDSRTRTSGQSGKQYARFRVAHRSGGAFCAIEHTRNWSFSTEIVQTIVDFYVYDRDAPIIRHFRSVRLSMLPQDTRRPFVGGYSQYCYLLTSFCVGFSARRADLWMDRTRYFEFVFNFPPRTAGQYETYKVRIYIFRVFRSMSSTPLGT